MWVLPAGDMIVASLATSQFCLYGVTILNNLLTFSEIDYYQIPWNFINTLTSWLTVWLVVFYCVKITVFSYPVFFWLKWRISPSMPRLLLGSLVLAGLRVISSATGTRIFMQMLTPQSSQGNSTLADSTALLLVSCSTSYNVYMVDPILPILGVHALVHVLTVPALGADEGT